MAAAAAWRPDLRPDEGLCEIGQGDWEGRTEAEIEERWREQLAAWRADPTRTWAPGGESPADVAARLRPAIDRLTARLESAAQPRATATSPVLGYGGPSDERPWTIVVAHDGVFKVLLLTMLGLPLEAFWSFSFALCGISVIDLRAGRRSLRAMNLTDHLASVLDEVARAEAAERETSGAL